MDSMYKISYSGLTASFRDYNANWIVSKDAIKDGYYNVERVGKYSTEKFVVYFRNDYFYVYITAPVSTSPNVYAVYFRDDGSHYISSNIADKEIFFSIKEIVKNMDKEVTVTV